MRLPDGLPERGCLQMSDDMLQRSENIEFECAEDGKEIIL
jgi:hypothetical protein